MDPQTRTRPLLALQPPSEPHLHADATAPPFDDAAFHLVVIYNALMDADDMPGAVVEAARVLECGGHLCVSVTHPVFNAAASMGTALTRRL